MGTVVLGWQIYALTGSALALGMVGLVQFVPSAVLVLSAGHAADRYDRQRIVQICQCLEGAAAAFLAWGSFAGWLTVPEIFGAIGVFGIAGAFESPAGAALLPGVVPPAMVQRGTALSSGVFQLATIAGPAIGGLAYALSPGVPYAVMAAFWLVSGTLNGAIALGRTPALRSAPTTETILEGVKFVRSNRALLGAISLDLFAVLFGGATALLPIYARDVLHTGPWGLGVLRAAPAVGALIVTVVLARRSLRRRVGSRMFAAVIIFGVFTVVFAFSRSIVLSLVALAIMGAADTVSVVIRASLVQLGTPDAMRGRVSAVNFLFINASNQLGAFESGTTAALLGAIPAVALGGAASIVIALLWMKLFPALRNIERLE